MPGDLGRRRHLAEVVERADREHHAGAEHEPDRLGRCRRTWRGTAAICEATAIATRNPTNIAAPPSVGVGFVCTPRGPGGTTAPDADREPPDERREERTCRPPRPPKTTT